MSRAFLRSYSVILTCFSVISSRVFYSLYESFRTVRGTTVRGVASNSIKHVPTPEAPYRTPYGNASRVPPINRHFRKVLRFVGDSVIRKQ